MLTLARSQDTSMRDLEQELADAIRRREGDARDPMAGLFTLKREMDADEDDQFDVDTTILDFLTYKAANAVFEWKASAVNSFQSDLPSALVTMTDEWRRVLKHRHSGRRLDSNIAFRSRLLQFALLFTHRFNHDTTWTTADSLNDIREQNKVRGYHWKTNTKHAPALRNTFDTRAEFPLSDGQLAETRHKLATLLEIPQDKRRWVTDLEGTASLHTLLPLFVELTAARTRLDDGWQPSKQWLELAGEFMLQTVLEEYLCMGAFGADVFDTIFSFGCPGPEASADEPSAVQAMRRVFCDQDSNHEQIHGWSKIRRRYISELLPQDNTPSSTHYSAMQDAQKSHSYLEFEAQMLAFLRYLHDGMVKPDLVQVEQGRITIHGEELSESESQDMIRRMGL